MLFHSRKGTIIKMSVSNFGAGGGTDSIRVGPGPAEKMLPVNLAALCLKARIDAGPMGADPEAQRLSNAPLFVHAAKSLEARGTRFDPYGPPEDIIAAALASDGPEHIRMDSGGYNRPGSFPNLLSNLANKILDEGVQNADTSYRHWTGRMSKDLPDFKPAPVVAKGTVGELDQIMDGEELKEQSIAEELLGMMQLGRFGNKVVFTPIMGANDDLGAFAEDLLGLAEALELSINRLCLSLVVSNVELLDGYRIFDNTNHANDIASGGNPPSDSEWDAMNTKMAAQPTIGGKALARSRLAVALVPRALERRAVQSFATQRDFMETKVPTTDSDLNVYRGKVTIVGEPELDLVSNKVWYGFADPRNPRNATVVRGYQKGFPETGKKERWYDPGTKCMNFSLEGRFAAAVKQYRTAVRNKGEA